MKKKWLVCLLSVACLTASALVSCKEDTSTQEKNEIEKVYVQYVLHAEAEGETPLSYKDWLATIKGEKGDKGDKGDDGRGIEKVEYDENNNLVIFYTDDTHETVSMPKQEGTAGLHIQKIPGKEEYAVVGIGLAEASDVVIPSSYKGLPVTTILEWAFYECFCLTSVVIGDNVKSIGEGAFERCYNLTSVVIARNTTSIGYGAFYYCEKLTIYCKAESKPDDWDEAWNLSHWTDDGKVFYSVVWGYKGETN